MSYEIIRSISVRDGKVFMRSSSNNVSPKYYDERHSSRLTQILQEQGHEALEVEILSIYEGGLFKGGKNRYTRALRVLRHMPEYKSFDWRVPFGEEYDRAREARETEAFTELLKKALRTQLPKDKFVIRREWTSGPVFLKRISSKRARWVREALEATIFRYLDEAEDYLRGFSSSDSWKIVNIAT